MNKVFLNAIQNEDISALKELIPFELELQYTDDEGNTMLMVACKKGNLELVDFLLKNGFLQTQSFCGNTPLRIACENGYAKIVELLLNNKSALDECDGDLLQISCFKGYTQIVDLLLKTISQPVFKSAL